MIIDGFYRTVTEILLRRAVKRIVSASAPLPLISATVEVGAFIFQSKSGSAQRSRDRKEAAGGMKRRTDSHASDVGHWLGMTPLRGVRGDVGIAPYGRSIEGAGV